MASSSGAIIPTDPSTSTSTAVVAASNGTPENKSDSFKVPAINNNGEASCIAPKPILILVNKGAGVTNEVEIIKRRFVIDGDGAGDDKKLTKLAETYIALVNDDEDMSDIQDRLNSIVQYENFKSLLKQTDGIRTNVAKTYHAILTNTKAYNYWETLRQAITKEMEELKTIVQAVKQKAADVKRNKKECQEREALVKVLDQVKKRDELTRELKKLREDYGELLIRQSELDEQLKSKKTYLNYLFDLVKRLDGDESQTVECAVTEAEERVLSDVSMELE